MLTPSEFAWALAPTGVTTVIADPHEIANVLGVDGINYMIEDSAGAPVDIKYMLPSCVPATFYETSGAVIDSKITQREILRADILGLGEMMNFPGVLFTDPEVTAKIAAAKSAGKIIDGHAPALTGKELNAYVLAGIGTEHEAFTLKEAEEKLALGMYILIREGSAAKNLNELIPLAKGEGYRRLMFCSDDLHPFDLINRGSINYPVKLAISRGIDPVRAITIATLNAAECYSLKDRGAIAPGKIADMIIFDNFEDMNISTVIKSGKVTVSQGKTLYDAPAKKAYNISGFNLKKITADDIKLNFKRDKINVIGIIPDSIVTDNLLIDKSDIGDTSKIAVIERHRNTGNIGVGLVKGYNISGGAVATSIAHDSHNIIAIGDNDTDIVNAVNKLIDIKGGIVISAGGKIIKCLSLPVAGLMSDKRIEDVNNNYEELTIIARKMGVPEGVHPFMTLSFLALPVIPHLKITDKGLFDADRFEFIN
jgi:adenine deaminase